MPEMKRNFTKGKMNKDLDERLIPPGEYRDAMNIQVSTSEGSKVGTVQNILGNQKGCDNWLNDTPIPMESTTVGSIADEGNDTLYWMLAGGVVESIPLMPDEDGEYHPQSLKDMIIRKNPSGKELACEAVFVDKYGFIIYNTDFGIGSSITLSDSSYYSQVNSGMFVTGFDAFGNVSFASTLVLESGFAPLPPIQIEYISNAINIPAEEGGGGSGSFSGMLSLPPASLSANVRTFDLDTPVIENVLGVDVTFAGPGKFNQFTADNISGNFNQNNLPPDGHVQLWLDPGQSLPAAVQVGAEVNAGALFSSGLITNIQTTTLYASLNPFIDASAHGPLYLITIQVNSALGAYSGFDAATYEISGALDMVDPTGNSLQGEMFTYEDFNITVTAPAIPTLTVEDLAAPMLSGPGNEINVDPASSTLAVEIWNYIQAGVQVQVVSTGVWSGTGFNQACIDPASMDSETDLNWEIVECDDSGIAVSPTAFGTQMFFQPIGSEEAVWLEKPINLSTTHTLRFDGERILDFHKDRLITGINIVDGMLFWTDNFSEPKKINIERSLSGTPNGNDHTKIARLKPNGVYEKDGPVKLEHVTVIKKPPHMPPTLNMSDDIREGLWSDEDGLEAYNPAANDDGTAYDENFLAYTEPGQEVWMFVDGVDDIMPGFLVGDILKLASDEETLRQSTIGHEFRVKILEIATNQDSASHPNWDYPIGGNTMAYLVEIISISDTGIINSTNTLRWQVALESDDKYLFEQKFPRFAYRYKYTDNEYSSFSPFSDVAFVPGEFEYQSVKAYNTGMTNRLRSLTIQDFVPIDIPKDVVQVDILYKEDASPNIYVVASLNKYDSPGKSGVNAWNSIGSSPGANSATGSYKITSENIYAALPENQSLRTWDNVPKKALAQEVTANRLVYANYFQGYEIKEFPTAASQIIPDISVSLKSRTLYENNLQAKKSIKSLRNYSIGVVWGDRYGRETPVIAPSSGSLIVPKAEADKSNSLEVSLDKSPHWADYYRFYIKETSSEYYNLAADRVYDAKDGNWWVSFPSTDRNKIDEDTYLVLKKGINSDDLIFEPNRYKVIAIDNEAPEYIKTVYSVLAKTNTDATRPTSYKLFGGQGAATTSVATPRSAPSLGKKFFTLSVRHWAGDYSTGDDQMQLTSPIKLLEETNRNASEDTLYVSFSRENTNTSSDQTISQQGLKYKVIDVSEEVEDTSSDDQDGDFYVIKLEKPIGKEDEFVVENMANNANNIHVTFWKQSVINKPEFDGRFFVKIYADDSDFSNYLNTSAGVERDFRIISSISLFKIEDSNLTTPVIDSTGTHYNVNTNIDNIGEGPGSFDTPTKNRNQWRNLLKYGGTSRKSNWFIDNATFAGKQPNNSNDYKNSKIGFGIPGLPEPVSASDRTTEQNWVGRCYKCNFGAGGFMPGGMPYRQGFYTDPLGTGLSNGKIGMKGVHEVGNDKYIDISYALLPPDGIKDAFSGTTKGRRQLTWDVGEGEMEDQRLVVGNLTPDTLFRLSGSEVIYRIKGVRKFRLYNWRGANTAKYASKYIKYSNIAGSATFWNSMHKGDDYTGSDGDYHQVAQHPPLVEKENRRVTYRIRYEIDEINTPISVDLDDTITDNSDITLPVANSSNSINLDFLTEFTLDGENKISTNPAIFETEPKESADIDIYYEASSSVPTFPITNQNKYFYIPIGSLLVVPSGGEFPDGIFTNGWDDIQINQAFITVNLSDVLTESEIEALAKDEYIRFLKDDGDYVTAKIHSSQQYAINSDGENVTSSLNIIAQQKVGLSWYNCWSFGNGVESNRIADTFNKPFLTNGATVSSIIEGNYKEEHRKYGLIYSGLYNSNSGTNNLNQFIAGEKITKDINPTYGSIQKLYSRSTADGDLITLCEDRVLKILANKDAVFNADGNINLVATDNVLGQAIPYSGEYGISKNPESFASEAYRVYFADKQRGAVLRLSRDGLTPISDFGMKNWFRDNLRTNQIIGSYDDKKDQYNITTRDFTETSAFNNTITFKENVKGWVSFKSFIPENAISCGNEYYTFMHGELWKHHADIEDNRNIFYGNTLAPSSFKVILNDAPGVIKSFYTLNYEGSQSKVDELDSYPIYIPGTTIPHSDYIDGLSDGEYYNLQAKEGWYVQNIRTDKEEGSLNEFIEKEGKWYNYIKGNTISSINDSGVVQSGFDNADSSFQGLGVLSTAPTMGSIFGCTDPTAFNYNDTAGVVDDGSCIAIVNGCTNPSAANYDATANIDDGGCIIYGCTNDTALNYDSTATIDNGSCVADNSGCTDASQFSYTGTSGVTGIYNTYINYNPFATSTCDDTSCYGSQTGLNCCCEPTVIGCMQEFDGFTNPMSNYDPLANTEPIEECIQTLPGCTDSIACNYDVNSNSDDGSCYYCSGVGLLVPLTQLDNDTDGNVDDCNDGCIICKNIDIDDAVVTSTETSITVQFQQNWDTPAVYGSTQTYLPATVNSYDITITDNLGLGSSTTVNVSAGIFPGLISYTFTGLPSSEQYNINIQANCDNSFSDTFIGFAVTQDPSAIISGCVDDGGIGNPFGTWGACNFDASATHDCTGSFAGGGGGDTSCCDYASCAGCDDPLYLEFCDTCWDPVTQTVVSDGSGGPWSGNSDTVTSGDIPPGGGFCTNLIVYGCDIETCENFDELVNVNDGSCIGCSDGGIPIPGCTVPTAPNYNEDANVNDGSCIIENVDQEVAQPGCPVGTPYAYNQTVDGTQVDHCEYCETDPGVATATLSGNYDDANPMYTVDWTNAGTKQTNSAGSGVSNNSYHAVGYYDSPPQDTSDKGWAYVVKYKYKLQGGAFTGSWVSADFNSQLSPASGGCPTENWVSLPYDDNNNQNYVSSSAGAFGFKFGKDNPIFGPDDGRYNPGTEWVFYVKNTCHGTYSSLISNVINCSVNGPLITTPTFLLPFIEDEPEE